MRYQPNFCNHCGEKIERPSPTFTDSTRFCDVCKHDFVPLRAAPFVCAALMAVFGLFGLGTYFQRGGGEKTFNVSPKQFSANSSDAAKNPANNPPVNSNSNAALVAQNSLDQKNAALRTPSAKSPARLPAVAAAEEKVYFCGAATKKGTPCSRRVRGGGRCWQHQGQAAILPDEKLTVSQ